MSDFTVHHGDVVSQIIIKKKSQWCHALSLGVLWHHGQGLYVSIHRNSCTLERKATISAEERDQTFPSLLCLRNPCRLSACLSAAQDTAMAENFLILNGGDGGNQKQYGYLWALQVAFFSMSPTSSVLLYSQASLFGAHGVEERDWDACTRLHAVCSTTVITSGE